MLSDMTLSVINIRKESKEGMAKQMGLLGRINTFKTYHR